MTLEERLSEALARPEEEGPVGGAVRILLDEAAREGISDLHLNPGPEGLDIFFRLDGVLTKAARVEPSRAERFLGRIKVLSGLLTYRRDIAQDGQIPAAQAGGGSDVRVSILPTIHGEKAVLRFFLHDEGRLDLSGLGFPRPIEERLRALAARPDGVLLLTGPSGSGKTTTIYALLAEILRTSGPALRHIVTIEDPVERVLPGVTQTQTNPAAGITFGYALRALLRQDPQVILVGEIRDRETARVAMEAGLTGHLVISTIHAGTAAGVVARLREMEVESHVLLASLAAVLAQRLVRRRCPDCERGCPACRGTRYRGRQVFAELLEADDAVREAVAAGASRAALEDLAARRGMVPLGAAAAALLREGVTTEEEVKRVMG